METEYIHRKLRYLVAAVGFVLIAIELALAFNEVALYQSLVFSIYLLFNILIDLRLWIDEHYAGKKGRKLGYLEGKLVGGLILIPFWSLFNWLLGLIAPSVPQETIWLYSLAIVIASVITASVPDYLIKERSFTEKKRKATRRAIGVLIAIVAPYVTSTVILSAYGVLPRLGLSLAMLAFLPIMLFAVTVSSMIATSSHPKDALAGGTFFAAITAIPLVVTLLFALPASYQIPYIGAIIVGYACLLYWLRSVRMKNRQKRERKADRCASPDV